MFRLVNIINVCLSLIALGLILTVIIVKSTIANEAQQTRALTANLDSAYARRDALEAEWARLQHRASILALGQALFDGGVEEIAEEVSATDIPLRDPGVDERPTALALFMLSLKGQNQDTSPLSNMTASDFITAKINEYSRIERAQQ